MVKNITALCTFLLLATAAQVSHAQMGGAFGQLQRGAAKAGGDAANHIKDRYLKTPPPQTSRLSEDSGSYVGSPLQKQRQQEHIRNQVLAAQQQARIRQQQIDTQRQQQQQFADNLSGLIDSTRQLGREIKAEKQRREQERQTQWQRQQDQYRTQPAAPSPYTPNPYAQQPTMSNPYAPQPAIHYPQPLSNPGYYQPMPMPIQNAPVQYRGW